MLVFFCFVFFPYHLGCHLECSVSLIMCADVARRAVFATEDRKRYSSCPHSYCSWHLYNLYIIKWFIFNVYTCPESFRVRGNWCLSQVRLLTLRTSRISQISLVWILAHPSCRAESQCWDWTTNQRHFSDSNRNRDPKKKKQHRRLRRNTGNNYEPSCS